MGKAKKEYKALRIYAFSDVEKILNQYAGEGWEVLNTNSVTTGMNTFDEAGMVSEIQSHLFILLQRNIEG